MSPLRRARKELGRDELGTCGQKGAGTVTERVDALAGFEQVECQGLGLTARHGKGHQHLAGNRRDEAIARSGEGCGPMICNASSGRSVVFDHIFCLTSAIGYARLHVEYG